MKSIRTLSFFLMLFLSFCAGSSADDICYDKAFNELFIIKSWKGLHAWHKQYSACDEGFLAEGLSEYVTVLLASHPESYADLHILADDSPQFRAFILRHIDASADRDNLKAIAEKAGHGCPSAHKALCSEIEQRALIALKELNPGK